MNSRTALVSAVLATALLAACSSSSRSTQAAASTDPGQTTQPTTPASADAFTQSVEGVLATTSDSSSPQDITGIAVISSETAAPVALY